MMRLWLTPYFHPTVCLAVGSNPALLSAAVLAVSKKYDVDIASDWPTAKSRLHRLNETFESVVSRCLPANALSLDDKLHDQTLRGFKPDGSLARAHMRDPNRSQKVSVVMIVGSPDDTEVRDFALETARFPVRRLLIADRRETDSAISALNHRCVDSLLFSDQISIADSLDVEIRRLQTEYFKCSMKFLGAAFSTGDTAFLRNAEFQEYFHRLLADHDVTEYYVSSNPAGVLLVKVTGEQAFLMSCNEESRRAHSEIAASEEAPRELLSLLASDEVVAYFPTEHGFYMRNEVRKWRDWVWINMRSFATEGWRHYLLPQSRRTPHIFDRVSGGSERTAVSDAGPPLQIKKSML